MLLFALLATAAGTTTFLAVGDWGGHDDHQPTTAAQVATADGMAKVAKEKSAEAVLLLGDNFYMSPGRRWNSMTVRWPV